MKIVALASVLILLGVGSAEARPHRHSHHQQVRHYQVHHHVKRTKRQKRPRIVAARVTTAEYSDNAVVQRMGQDLGKSFRRKYGGQPWCGFYLGDVIKEFGYELPKQYPWAANWRHFGHAVSGPAPGVVMVFNGHVGVVIRALGGGQVLVRSGNHGDRVGDGIYSTRRAIAWRAP